VLHDTAMPVQRWLSDAALSRLGFVSTAGPAFIALLCQQKLAGVEALRRAG
jgi:3-phosphoglycerate kinase